MYRDSKDALNKAQHILASDIPLWLAINHAALDNSINKIIKTFKEHHNCKFIFVSKKDMGAKIIELLGKHRYSKSR